MVKRILVVVDKPAGLYARPKACYNGLTNGLNGDRCILYINRQGKQYRVVGVFAEVLAGTMWCIAESAENPFEAFDAYPDNYDDILREAARE